MNLRLDWCSHEAAKYAVENWHYSKSIPLGKTVKMGVWEDSGFIGAIVFSPGISNILGRRYGLKNTETTELVRVALTCHKTPVTKIISIALKMLKEQSLGLKIIVSFADTAQGHIGTIYQAGNWAYTGMTSASTAYIGPNGKKYHRRMVNKAGIKTDFGRTRKCYRPDECTKVWLPGKHRYLYPLDKKMAKKIEPLRRPYPKRAGSIDDDAPAIQAGKGGSIPTSALQHTDKEHG